MHNHVQDAYGEKIVCQQMAFDTKMQSLSIVTWRKQIIIGSTVLKLTRCNHKSGI
jgi:hypothetical protein